MTRWDLVYKWADPRTQSIVDAVTSALENCDRKLTEAYAERDAVAEDERAAVDELARSTPAETLDCGICGKHVMEAVCLDCYERNLDGG